MLYSSKNVNTNKNNKSEILDKIDIIDSNTISNEEIASFKIIVIGDPGVGKTCITVKATQKLFLESYKSTIGFDFSNLSLKVNDSDIIKLQIWDTCGQEAYRSLVTNFYRSASLAIIVYSITEEQSFSNWGNWINDWKWKSSPEIKIILIGNKVDLQEKRQVSQERALKFVQENRIDLYLETSAKNGDNIDDCFIEGTRLLYKEYKRVKKLMENGKYEDDDDEAQFNYIASSSFLESKTRNFREKDIFEKKHKMCC